MLRRFGIALVCFAGLLGLAVVVRSLPEQPDVSLAQAALHGRADQPLRFNWRLVEGKHWQIISDAAEDRAETDRREGNRGACGEGMIEIEGKMRMDPPNLGLFDTRSIEEQQKLTCTKWINREYPERCASFDREKWLAIAATYATKDMHFCMDRFEYPNQKGQYPIIFANYNEAEAMCAREGKRLCDEEEWTFACEGEEATPYPYGYVRDTEACVIDLKWRAFNATAMHPRDGDAARGEMDRLWQGVPSGSSPRCKSPFGVYDMTGNIDEWTTSTRPGRVSILKGGYWGPVRTRCRPSTRSHDENHTFYQQGFRCCADVGAIAPINASFGNDPSEAPIPRELK